MASLKTATPSEVRKALVRFRREMITSIYNFEEDFKKSEKENERLRKRLAKIYFKLPTKVNEKGIIEDDFSVLSEEERKKLDKYFPNRAVWIWKDKPSYYGKEKGKQWYKEYGKYPTVTFDSLYYDIMTNGDEYLDLAYQQYTCRLDYRLEKLGCMWEWNRIGEMDIACNEPKSTLKGSEYKEKFIKEYPWCKPYISDMR